MPKLPAVIDKLDAVEEPYRGAYVEQDGKYVLDADVEAHPTVAGLRTTKEKERADRKKAEAALQAFKDVDPERYRQLVKEAEERDGRGDKGDKTDVAAKVAKREKEIREELAKDLAERDALKAENRKLKITDNVRAAYIAAGGFEEDADDVVRLTEKYFDLDDKGKLITLDDEGDDTGKSPKDWFEKVYKAKKPKLFKASGASGSGAREATGGSGSEAELRNLPGARMVEAAFAGGTTKAK